MRRLALTAVVLAAMASAVPANASTGDDADAMGVLNCTFALVNSVGFRPYPTTPIGTVSYASATAFDGVNYAFCVAI